LAERSPESSPTENTELVLSTPMSPPGRLPLIALGWTSEYWVPDDLALYWLHAPTANLGRSWPRTTWSSVAGLTPSTNQRHHPLMPLPRRSENDPSRIPTASRNRKRHVPLEDCLPWGSSTLRRSQKQAATKHRNYLNRLCCAFRLPRPPDALFRLNPFPPCFMRVTPMGF
jgi:hypothetical protein